MQVYSAYLKITRKHILSLMIYVVVFVVIALIISNALQLQSTGAFSATKLNIAFIDRDGGTDLVNGLYEDLEQNAHIVEIEDSAQSIQDALFFGNVAYVLVVPEGFTQRFVSGPTPRSSGPWPRSLRPACASTCA